MTPEERSIYFKKYREQNKEKLNANKRNHYQKNKEKIAKKHREYNQFNKEKVSEYKKQWRKANPKPYKYGQKSRPAKTALAKEFSNFVKQYLGCRDCGNNNPIVLQFHHVDRKTKKYNLSTLVQNGCTLKTVKKEMQKCIVICANCHLILHHFERQKTK